MSGLLVKMLVSELVDRGWGMIEETFVDPETGRHHSIHGAVRVQVARELERGYRPHAVPDDRGLQYEADPDDPAIQLAHRAMEAIRPAIADEFRHDEYVPKVTVIAAAPPTGRIGLASTEPGPGAMMAALIAAQGVVRRAIRLQTGRQ